MSTFIAKKHIHENYYKVIVIYNVSLDYSSCLDSNNTQTDVNHQVTMQLKIFQNNRQLFVNYLPKSCGRDIFFFVLVETEKVDLRHNS